MGIQYTLANKKNKTAYELGKGDWYFLADVDRSGSEILLYEDTIYDEIVNNIFQFQLSNCSSKKEHEELLIYCAEIAKQIFDFVKDVDPIDIMLCNDCDDSNFELREQGFRWIGSRYESADLCFLNRHLSAR